MAVVPYYDQTKVKLDLRITDTALDTQLDHWDEEATADIDDMLWQVTNLGRDLPSLPTLPFTVGSVPEAIQGAADHYVKARYYEFTKNPDLMNMHERKWKEKAEAYLRRLDFHNKEIYGRIAR